MYRILALCCFLGLSVARQPAAPQHNADNLPNTEFSCRDKVLGGYYADPDAQCQMFHVCVKVAGVGIQDYRFLCPNGTAFDQEAQICAGWPDVACEPSALYYSSDNFDLYRIGSGFESKKAPAALEEESDFHLQRSEPDILSGAHSSNFFNNRESKDVQDVSRNGGQNRNQVEPQRKKIIKKIQRRPTESSYDSSSTQRQNTNNFAGSYTQTTTVRPTSFRTSPQPQQYNENYNKQNNFNNNQQYKQISSTVAPNNYYNSNSASPSYNDYQKTEKSTTQNNNKKSFNQRQQPTYEINYNANNENKPSQINNNSNFNKNPVQNQEPRNYNADNSDIYKSTQQPSRRNHISRQRGQQTYRNQQVASNYNSESSPQYHSSTQAPVQNNANINSKASQNERYNNNQGNYNNHNGFNNGNIQNRNQETTYQIKFSTPSTQQTTARNINDYSQKQLSTYNNYNNDDFGKIQSTTKYEEKKIPFSTTTKSQYDESQNNQKYSGNPQTPPPKFNTNLLYDNNQQSTPDYYRADYNQDFKTSYPSTTTNKQFQSNTGSSGSDFNQNQRKANEYSQYSTAQPFAANQGVSKIQKTFEQRSSTTTTVQKFSTSQPSSFNNGFSQTPRPYDSKPIADVQKISTSQPSSFGLSQNYQSYEPKSTAFVQKASTAQPFNQGTNYNQNSFEQKPISNVQQYSTALPSFNQGTDYTQKALPQKSSSNNQQYSSPGLPINVQNNQRFQAKSSVAPSRFSNSNDYDDGQYRPEIHEREAGGEYDVTTSRKSIRQEEPRSQETEFLKTAHSINIAASRNQLARERQSQTSSPSSTRAPVPPQQKIVQTIPKIVQTTPAAKSASSILPVLTSTQPRPFSVRPKPDAPSPPQPKKIVEKKVLSVPAKSGSSLKSKDVSYDYAYYDNSEPYSEYENIEEFGKTPKKQ